MLNPYSSFAAGRDPRAVIADTPRQLQLLLESLGAPGLDRGLAPGKWSAREILCHLADCEVVFAYRLRQALAEPHHTIQPFDQEIWASRYTCHDANSALQTFSVVRQWNLSLIGAASPEDLQKPVTHPERGTMTFETIVETMAGHDLNHVRQLETIAAQ
jgi:hypothetical protein